MHKQTVFPYWPWVFSLFPPFFFLHFFYSANKNPPIFLGGFFKRWDHWGYVRYKTEAEALVAIAELNETSMDGPADDGHDGWWGRCSWSPVVDLWLFFLKEQ